VLQTLMYLLDHPVQFYTGDALVIVALLGLLARVLLKGGRQ